MSGSKSGPFPASLWGQRWGCPRPLVSVSIREGGGGEGKMRWEKGVRLGGVFPSGTRGGFVSFIENIKQKQERGKEKREIDLAML